MTSLTSFKNSVDGTIYKVGDSVIVHPQEGDPPYVGKIHGITHRAKRCKLRIAWYYRPEEIHGGRKMFHGAQELFTSDHYDEIDAASIKAKCMVYSLEDYLKDVDGVCATFFTRYQYHAATQTFSPSRAECYCVCEMPYNPDLPMICCDACQEWYHAECMGIAEDEVEALSHFVCEQCAMSEELSRLKRPRMEATVQH